MKSEFKRLVPPLINLANKNLEKFGEFFPFAMAINMKGEIEIISGIPNNNPTASEVFEFLQKALRTGLSKNKYMTVGICSNVNLKDTNKVNTSALEIHLSNKTEKHNIIITYTKNELNKYKFVYP